MLSQTLKSFPSLNPIYITVLGDLNSTSEPLILGMERTNDNIHQTKSIQVFRYYVIFVPDLTAPAESLLVTAPQVPAPGGEYWVTPAPWHLVTQPPGPPGARPAPFSRYSRTKEAVLVLGVDDGDWATSTAGLYQRYFCFCEWKLLPIPGNIWQDTEEREGKDPLEIKMAFLSKILKNTLPNLRN